MVACFDFFAFLNVGSEFVGVEFLRQALGWKNDVFEKIFYVLNDVNVALQ